MRLTWLPSRYAILALMAGAVVGACFVPLPALETTTGVGQGAGGGTGTGAGPSSQAASGGGATTTGSGGGATTTGSGGAGPASSGSGGAASGSGGAGGGSTGAGGALPPCSPGDVDTLVDDFDDNVLTNWGSYGQGISETGGALHFALDGSKPNADYAGVHTLVPYDLRGCQMIVELVSPPALVTGVGAFFDASDGAGAAVVIEVESGNTQAYVEDDAGAQVAINTVAFNATLHRWWRIREAAGTVYLETSPDASAWTEIVNGPTPMFLSAADVELGAGTFQMVNNPGEAVFDNLNVPP